MAMMWRVVGGARGSQVQAPGSGHMAGPLHAGFALAARLEPPLTAARCYLVLFHATMQGSAGVRE